MKYEKDLILYLDEKVLADIIKCVENASPNEACGLLFGKIQEIKIPDREEEFSYYYNAFKFECVESLNKNPIAFLMDDYIRLVNLSDSYTEDYDYQLLSIFHSHPGSAYPSGIDLPYMESHHKGKTSKLKHIIWTIMNAENKELNGFIFIENELNKISIKYREK
ncbi:MAG: Mov34/MPN/PAD-1 family protein [Candidatus Hermodarchaeota archaeon]